MTERASFYRKIAYLIALAVLAIMMFWISTPATANRPGGQLARMREEFRLGQSNLGEVDPASETMRFLTLGLRGVAVTVLWNKANEFKKKEDWTNLTATLEQLAKLQPNFITFWKYQAWNLTYNVSVEFDDYRDRYYYVRRGIQFLQEGETYNRDHPLLLSDLGWFTGNKIGRADEKALYRRLFKQDDEFHPPERTADERDNWLVSKQYYLTAINAVDVGGKSLGQKSPREFYSDPAKSQINYAEAIEEEGLFEKARRAWVLAGKEWRDFGRHPLKHTFGDTLILGDEPRLKEKVEQLTAQLNALGPTTREDLKTERRNSLKPEELALLDTPREQLTTEQSARWYDIEAKTIVTELDVAERIARDQPEKTKDILILMRQLDDAERVLRYTQSYKETSNFDFWQLRCDYEQTDDAVAARRILYNAHKAAQNADLLTAKPRYEEGFAKWRLVIDEFPQLIEEDIVFGDHIVDYTKKYRDVLDQLGETLGDSYPLWDALEKFDSEKQFTEDIARHRQEPPAAEPAPAR